VGRVGIIAINAISPLYSSQMVIYGASFNAVLDGLAVLFAHVNGSLTTTRQAMTIASQSQGGHPVSVARPVVWRNSAARKVAV
jgi:hypothetical protein